MTICPEIAVRDIERTKQDEGIDLSILLENVGKGRIESLSYGSLEYRLIVRITDDDGVILDRWLALDGDLGEGERRALAISFRPGRGTHRLSLTHGIQGVPVADQKPFFSAEVDP